MVDNFRRSLFIETQAFFENKVHFKLGAKNLSLYLLYARSPKNLEFRKVVVLPRTATFFTHV